MGLFNYIADILGVRVSDQEKPPIVRLKRRKVEVRAYIRDLPEPVDTVWIVEDRDVDGDWYWAWASNDESFKEEINKKITNSFTKGFKCGNTWYAPSLIQRIELGEETVEDL